MAIDLAALTAPLSDEQPSGPDLAYDGDRQQIESVFERVGSGDTASEEVDWREAIKLISDQAVKTRDLWLPVYWMRAGALAGQFDTVVEAAELLAALLEERWEDVHPSLEEYSFIGRKTPCESLTRIGDFLRPLGNVVLLEHPRLGRYTGTDFQRFHDQGSDAENYGMFRALIEATPAEDLQLVVDRLDALRQAIRRADKVLTDNADGDTGTNFEPTYEALERIRRAVVSNLPAEAQAAAEEGAGTLDEGYSSSGGVASAAPSGEGFSGAVRSREDVIAAIESINAYYARFEPASPVPFALRRAKEWISLDFLSVLEDIAPGSLEEAQRVLKGRAASDGQAGYASNETGSSASSDDSW